MLSVSEIALFNKQSMFLRQLLLVDLSGSLRDQLQLIDPPAVVSTALCDSRISRLFPVRSPGLELLQHAGEPEAQWDASDLHQEPDQT